MEEVSAMSPDLSLQRSVFDVQILIESERKASVLHISAEKLKIEHFRSFLSRRLPLVITGLNSSLCLSWSPSQLIDEYGNESCTMEDCEARCQPLQVLLADFLSLFSPDCHSLGNSSLPEAIWKVKVGIVHVGLELSYLII